MPEDKRSLNYVRPLHLLLMSPTLSIMGGADRDWVTLANALGPERIRISWAGKQGCEGLAPYLDAGIATRILDVGLPWFTYLIQDNAYEKRSTWLWTKILGDHSVRLIGPLRRLRRALRNDPVDVVVSNTAAVTLGALFAKLHRKPHVWCIKECLDPSIPACRSFARWVARMSSAVIVPSQAAAKPFTGPVNVFPDGSNVQAIHIGAKRSSRAEVLQRLNLPRERPVVVQVGGVVHWKGQDITARAFVDIAAQGKNQPFSLLFLGCVSAPFRERVESILAGAPREWRELVRFESFNPDDFSYLSASDIVVHPSVLPDPFPNAVREAMILGKPVIASGDGGIPEMIRDGETGILVEPGNSVELAAAITSLLNSREQRELLGEAAKQFGTRQFDIHVRKEAFFTLFRNLVDAQSLTHASNSRADTVSEITTE